MFEDTPNTDKVIIVNKLGGGVTGCWHGHPDRSVEVSAKSQFLSGQQSVSG